MKYVCLQSQPPHFLNSGLLLKGNVIHGYSCGYHIERAVIRRGSDAREGLKQTIFFLISCLFQLTGMTGIGHRSKITALTMNSDSDQGFIFPKILCPAVSSRCY